MTRIYHNPQYCKAVHAAFLLHDRGDVSGRFALSEIQVGLELSETSV